MSDGQLIEIDEDGTAIAEPTENVHEIKDLVAHLEREGCNILAPRTYMQGGHDRKLVVRLAKFDPDRDFFRTQQGKFSPHKKMLNEIASAMGIRWVPEHCDLEVKNSNFAAAKATCEIPDPATGELRRHVAQYALDLQDGSERAENLSDAQLSQKRRHIAALADTGAKLRAVREATGVRTDYTKDEIRQYFAIVTTYDDNSPEQLPEAEQAAEDVYGDAGALEAPEPEEPDYVDPEDAFGGGSDDETDRGRTLPSPGEFPDPVDWKAMPSEERDRWVADAVAVSDYDLDEPLAGTQHAGSEPEDLPFEWQQKLYERVYVEHFESDVDVEDPPF